MSRLKFIKIIDLLFIIFITFLISFAIIQFFLGSYVLSTFLAIILTFSILIIVNFINTKKYEKQSIKENNRQLAENNALNFQTYPEQKKLNLVLQLIPDTLTKKIVGQHIEFYNENNNFKSVIIIENNIEKIDKTTLINLAKTFINKTHKLIIICNNYETELDDFVNTLQNIKIMLIDKYSFFEICQKTNLKIEETIQFKKINKSYLKFFKNFFNKKHFKGFLLTGIITLFTSWIVPFKTYYLVVSCILLIGAIMCIFPKNKIISKKWYE